MATEKDIKDQWTEVLDYAREHATGQGMHIGYKWLKDAFEEYLIMSEQVGGYNMGGQPGSQFNREVLSGRILQHFNGVGADHILNDEQLSRLKATLQDIVEKKTEKHLKI